MEKIQDIATLKSHGFYNSQNPLHKFTTIEAVATKADFPPQNFRPNNSFYVVVGWFNPLGRMTQYTLDDFGNVIQEILPDGAAYDYAYNAFGQVTRITEPDLDLADELPGPSTLLIYDALGNLIQKVLPDEDDNPNNNPLLSFSHDSHGLLLASTDARGFTTSFQRDNLGRVV